LVINRTKSGKQPEVRSERRTEMEKQIGSAGWINSKEAKMFRKGTLNTYNPFAIVIGISVLGLLVLLSAVAGPIAADWPRGGDSEVAVQRAVIGSEHTAYVNEHGSIVRLTGDVEPVARYEGSLAALTGEIEAAPKYEGSLAALTGQMEGFSDRAGAAWMGEIPEGFGSLVRVTGEVSAAPRYEGSLAALTGEIEAEPRYEGSLAALTGQFWAAPRYEGSLAAITGQMEPVAKFEGSLVELTGAGRSPRMNQCEFEKEFGPIVKLTG
jgi:hypothetical protein